MCCVYWWMFTCAEQLELLDGLVVVYVEGAAGLKQTLMGEFGQCLRLSNYFLSMILTAVSYPVFPILSWPRIYPPPPSTMEAEASCRKGEITDSIQPPQSRSHRCCVHIVTVTTGCMELFIEYRSNPECKSTSTFFNDFWRKVWSTLKLGNYGICLDLFINVK